MSRVFLPFWADLIYNNQELTALAGNRAEAARESILMIYSVKYASCAGLLTIAERNGRVIGLWIEGQKYFAGNVKEPMIQARPSDVPVLSQACSWLDRYFAGEQPSPAELPLAPEGSEFRRRVWDILCRIPYGQTITYGEIAKQMAAEEITAGQGDAEQFRCKKGSSAPKAVSAQAVGGAVGHNPISIIIPCHRVMGAGGNLTGYAGGIAVKKLLLELEGIDTAGFFVPKKGTAL